MLSTFSTFRYSCFHSSIVVTCRDNLELSSKDVKEQLEQNQGPQQGTEGAGNGHQQASKRLGNRGLGTLGSTLLGVGTCWNYSGTTHK